MVYACSACGALNVGEPDECPVCGQEDFEEVDLATYVCGTCGKGFDTQQGLNSHQRAHTDSEDDSDSDEDSSSDDGDGDDLDGDGEE